MTAVSSALNRLKNLSLPRNIEELSGPEKLVICMDIACVGQDFKKILKNFLEMKCAVNHHEISLAVITGNEVNFLCDFQSDVKNATSQLWGTAIRRCNEYNFHSSKEAFNLSKVFKLVQERALPFYNQNASLRIIILYGQVDCIPILENDTALESLREGLGLFTLDILYMPKFSTECALSRMQLERVMAQDIFKSFVDISDPKSYVFAVDESANIAACVLKFLAHPALRENQNRHWFV